MNKILTLFIALFMMSVYNTASSQISSYCVSGATSTADERIDGVKLETINNFPAPSCAMYTDFTNLSTTLAPGGMYYLSVQSGTCGGYYGARKMAWIDFDQSGTFDAGEVIYNFYTSSGTLDSAQFTVPPTAPSGPTYMRVIINETSATLNPCGTFIWGETEDYSILIKSVTPNDAAATAILEPNASCEGTYDVKARINNFGINQILSVVVEWSIAGLTQLPVNHTTLLDTSGGSGAKNAIIDLGTVTLAAGVPTEIKVWTSMPNNTTDPNPLNDTVAKTYNALPVISTYPYYEDFESGDGSWVISGTNSSWAFGTPASANIVGAASGDTCFVTSLAGSYNPNENSEVRGPCFDLSQISDQAWVSLDVNYYSENSWDGAVLQSSVDDGATWQNVGANGDPYNWYNDNTINGNPGGQQEGWTGTTTGSNGWKKAAHKLNDNLKRSGVLLRVAFGSDGSVQYEGFAFDNFAVVDFAPADLGLDKQSLCGANFVELDPHVNFNGTIVWSDGDSISQTITVSKDTVHWVTYTDSMLGVTTSDTVLIIQSPAPVISFESASETISIDATITLNPRTPYDLTYDWQPSGLTFPYLFLRGVDLGVGIHPYTLSVVDSVGCTDQKGVTVIVKDFTGINENEEASISYFPNPVDDILTIQLKGFADSQLSFEIIDLQGKVMLKESVTHQNNRTHTMNLANLPSGMYMLSVKGDNKSSLSKIVVN